MVQKLLTITISYPKNNFWDMKFIMTDTELKLTNSYESKWLCFVYKNNKRSSNGVQLLSINILQFHPSNMIIWGMKYIKNVCRYWKNQYNRKHNTYGKDGGPTKLMTRATRIYGWKKHDDDDDDQNNKL